MTKTEKKLRFMPANDLLLARKIDAPEKLGEVILAATSEWQKWAKIVRVAPRLNPLLDVFEEGETIIYQKSAPVLDIRLDDVDYLLIKKEFVITKIVDED